MTTRLIQISFFQQMSTLQQQRLIVEQLRREAAIRRINVSQAVEEIKVKNFTEKNTPK